jgi:undecaprenyl-diphosphatase
VSRTIAPEAPAILPPAMRRPIAVVAVLAALAVGVLAVVFAGKHAGTALDGALGARAQQSVAATGPLGKLVDFAGEPAGLAALVLLLSVLALLRRRPRVAALVVLGTGLAITVTSGLKPIVGRTIHEVFLSYPSGHTASATALAMIAVLLCWHRLRPGAALALLYGAALVAGAAAGWAQAGLGAHYVTDTVGGWCTALAVVPAAAWLVDHAAGRMASTRDRE